MFPFFSFLLIGSFLLSWLAFYNQYPIFTPDSFAYIECASVSFRSAGYSLFIIISSCNHSLFFTVFLQSLITSYLLIRIPCLLYKNVPRIEWLSFLSLIILILLTDVSTYVSEIMPEIFTSWIFLICWLFFLTPYLMESVLLTVLMVLCLSAHNSNILIAFFLLFTFLTLGLFYKKKNVCVWKACRKIILSIVLGFTVCCFLNMTCERTHQFQLFSPNGAQFVIAKLAVNKILSKTLKDYCPEKKWQMCKISKQLDKINDEDTDFFLWSSQSPLKKGGLLSNRTQLNEVALYAVKRYPLEILKESMKDTLKLLKMYKSGGFESISSIPIFTRYFITLIDAKSLFNSRQYKKLYMPAKPLALDEGILIIFFLLAALAITSIYLYKKRVSLNYNPYILFTIYFG